mmetsp:Transcript_13848/g.42912  ORF Transcript_13848/g.42912 Transcript_13848/m.42912 type:complete len:232 (-) Transcript_13848:789-1484(-)
MGLFLPTSLPFWEPMTCFSPCMPTIVPMNVWTRLRSSSSHSADSELRQRRIAPRTEQRVYESVPPWMTPVVTMSWIHVSSDERLDFHLPQFPQNLPRSDSTPASFSGSSAADTAFENSTPRSTCLKNSVSTPAFSRAARGAESQPFSRNSSAVADWPQAARRSSRSGITSGEPPRPPSPVIAAVPSTFSLMRSAPTSTYLIGISSTYSSAHALSSGTRHECVQARSALVRR